MSESDKAFENYTLEDWQSIAEKSLRGDTLDSLTKTTAGGLSIEPLYTTRTLSHPLLAQPLQPWDNRLAVINDKPENQNKALLDGLQNGISSAQLTLSSSQLKDHNNALAIEDIDAVLTDVQLQILPVSIKAGFSFIETANKLEAVWGKQNVDEKTVKASFNADPLNTIASTGDLTCKLDEQLQALGEFALATNNSYPKCKAVCVDTACYHNAGATINQELIASIATAVCYMQAMIDAGMQAQAAHDTIVFQVASDADALENVVKLRALRTLWHHTATHLGVGKPLLTLVVETSLRMQSTLSPWVNHLRNTSAAAAAAMGGAQSVIVHPHNFIDGVFIAKDVDKDIGVRVARNTAIILSEESRMQFTNDPMGGSYAVENLTGELGKQVWDGLQQLEKNGGFVQQLLSGEWQQQIGESQHARLSRLRDEQDIHVGVNRFTANDNNKNDATQNSIKNNNASPHALQTQRTAVEFEGRT